MTQSVSSSFHYPQSTVSSADTHFTSETQTVSTDTPLPVETWTNSHSTNSEPVSSDTLSTALPNCHPTTAETVSNDTFGCSPIPTWYSIEVIHQSETEVTYRCQDGYRFSKKGMGTTFIISLYIILFISLLTIFKFYPY